MTCSSTLVGAGLRVPEKSREKPVFVEHAGEILWLNRNAKGQLWLNARESKFAEKSQDATPATESQPQGEAPAAKRSAPVRDAGGSDPLPSANGEGAGRSTPPCLCAPAPTERSPRTSHRVPVDRPLRKTGLRCLGCAFSGNLFIR